MLLVSLAAPVFAQSTRIEGCVYDASSGDPLPYANIFLESTQFGTTSEIDGKYVLEARAPGASVVTCSLIGYESMSFVIVPGSVSEIDFRLSESRQVLNAALVKPDDRYVKSILRKVDDMRDYHNPELRDEYTCDLYSKMELDLCNADKVLRGKFFDRNFGFVMDYVDTSDVSGLPYLPVLFSETAAKRYHRLSPDLDKEIIEGTRVSGLDAVNALSQFTGSMHFRTNFYDRFVNAMNVDIPSPISGSGTLYYNYYLVDSLSLDGRKSYKIRFHPKKSISSPAFDGEMYIDAEEYALRDIHVRLGRTANVNWIRNLLIDVSNERGDSLWFYKEDRIYVDFALIPRDSTRLMSFIGRRHVSYSNPVYTLLPRKGSSVDGEMVSVEKNAGKKDDAYWESVRPRNLSEREQGIYTMVRRVKDVPVFDNVYKLGITFIKDYYNFIPEVGIGPYYRLANYNSLEGFRPQIGLRTTKELSENFRLSGYLAYGFKDREFKGFGQAEIMFSSNPTRKLTVSGKRDIRQLGRTQNVLAESNILSSVLSRDGSFNKRSPVNDFILSYEHEWRPGLTTKAALEFQRIFSNYQVPLRMADGTPVNSVGANKLHLTTRLSWDETLTRGVFDKYYVYTDHPIVTLDLTGSLKGLGNNDYTFLRPEVHVEYLFRTPPAGRGRIRFNAGHIFGKVPYPMLKLHEGNNTFFLDRRAFTCMDYYEFASDSWAQLLYEHMFGGFFLGKIPLIKLLQLREYAHFKVAYGTISDRNNDIVGNPSMSDDTIVFPEGLGSLNKPYVEMGVGIGNILHIFRVDAFWRMTHRYHTIDGIRTKDPHCFVVTVGAQVDF